MAMTNNGPTHLTCLMEGIWSHGSSTNRFALAGLDHHAWILQLEGQKESLFQNIDFTSMHDVFQRARTRSDVTDLFIVPQLQDLPVPAIKQDTEVELPSLGDLELPELPPLDDLQLSTPPLSLASLVDSRPEDANASKVPDLPADDLWRFQGHLEVKADVKYLTWNSVLSQTNVKPQATLLSEAGPAVFDAAQQRYGSASRHNWRVGKPIQSDIFVRCLSQLGLGRSSIMFPYSQAKCAFEQAVPDCRLSGTTVQGCQSLVQEVMTIGNTTVNLRAFNEKTYRSKSSPASKVALATAVATILDAIETYIVKSHSQVRSLVQLQTLFEQPARMIIAIKGIVDVVQLASNDEHVLSVVFEQAQHLEELDNMRDIMTEVLRLVSSPWLEQLQDLIGLSSDNLSQPAKLSIAAQVWDNLSSDQDHDNGGYTFPSIVQAEDRVKIVETNKARAFLQENHPDHGLLHPDIEASTLVWSFGWSDIAYITDKAATYHQSLLEALGHPSSLKAAHSIHNPSQGPRMIAGPDSNPWLVLEDPAQLAASLEFLDMVPKQTSFPDKFSETVLTSLSGTASSMVNHMRPPLSLSFHLSIKPLLDIQHQALTFAALKSIMHHHSLRMHLELLHSFQLCQSGTFSTRLSAALFDPEAEITERQKHKTRSGGAGMGLKLGSGERREWPPASSELSLALRDVLTDSWGGASSRSISSAHADNAQSAESNPTRSFTHNKSVILPGDLSFALRTDLQASEIDSILDADSLHALDFLRLNYTSPPALRIILTPSTLVMYDRIFRLLLRLSRLNFAIGLIFRATIVGHRGQNGTSTNSSVNAIHRFRNRAVHFMQTLTSSFTQSGIARPWQKLTHYIDALSTFTVGTTPPQSTAASNPTSVFTLVGLTAAHYTAIETISAALLLRKRQGRAATALEAAMGDILAFATLLRDDAEPRAEVVAGRYRVFERHVMEFVGACRETLERSVNKSVGMVEAGRDEGDECVRELVERLEERM